MRCLCYTSTRENLQTIVNKFTLITILFISWNRCLCFTGTRENPQTGYSSHSVSRPCMGAHLCRYWRSLTTNPPPKTCFSYQCTVINKKGDFCLDCYLNALAVSTVKFVTGLFGKRTTSCTGASTTVVDHLGLFTGLRPQGDL